MDIANCPKCNKLFQRTNDSLCPACQQASKSNVSAVYRYIYDHPNQTTEEIAKQCKVPLKELEALLLSGKLGTAAQLVIFHCQGCGKTITAMKQKGHFCLACATKLEIRGGTPDREAPDKATPKPIAKESHESKSKPVDMPTHALNDAMPSLRAEAASPKQESASSSSDSYGFTRGSEK